MTQPNELLRRAALLVSSLDTETADLLLERLSDEDAARVRYLVMELGDVDARDQRGAIDAFLQVGNAAAVSRRFDAGHRAPPAARGSLRRNSDDDAPPFRFLHEATAAQLAPILRGEHPQTVAVVVWHLPPARAVELLATLPGPVQLEVIRRLSDLEEADPDVLREVEDVLHLRIAEHAESQRRHAAGVQFLSRALDAAPSSLKRGILANVAQHDRQLANRLTDYAWSPSDLRRLRDHDLALVVSSATRDVVLLTLAGAAPELSTRIWEVIPASEASSLRRELQKLGPTRLADIEQSQHELVAIAEGLAVEGRIEFPNQRRASLALAG